MVEDIFLEEIFVPSKNNECGVFEKNMKLISQQQLIKVTLGTSYPIFRQLALKLISTTAYFN